MKHGIILTILVSILAVFGLLTACNQPTDKPSISPPVPVYTVNFMAYGGNPVPEGQRISEDDKVTEPPAMTKAGGGFGGWYKEAACINEWDFAVDTVTQDTILYAKWAANYYTVSFEADCGTPAPEPQNIAYGSKVVAPSVMSRDGYTFAGWYTEPEYVHQWSFTSNTVTSDITLYAEWETSVLVPGVSLEAKLRWLNANVLSGGSYTMELAADASINPTTFSYSGKDNITITIKGIDSTRVITLNTTGSMFTVEAGVTLILDGNLELQGRSDNISYLIHVDSNGTLIMNAGITITGNLIYNTTSTDFGAGVYVSGGTFTMNGGEISGNFANASSGGGIVVSNGIFTMNDGLISNNIAVYGGGINIAKGTFNMNGGEISGNHGTRGGGIYVANGIFTMKGGIISNNWVEGFHNSYCCGGGLNLVNGIFTMYGGIISGNLSSFRYLCWGGGGVYMDGGVLKKIGGTIFGFTDGDINSNKVQSSSTGASSWVITQQNLGSALCIVNGDGNYIKRKETTTGPDDDLFYDTTFTPSTWSGDWDY